MTETNIDPMDQDVSGIDTNFPRLAVGVYELKCTGAEVVENKAQTGNNLKLQFETINAAVSTSGEPMPSGARLSMYIGLVPSDRYSPADIAKKVAGLMKAAGIDGKPSAIVADPSQLVEKVVTAKVKVNKATDDFDESNSIASFVVKK